MPPRRARPSRLVSSRLVSSRLVSSCLIPSRPIPPHRGPSGTNQSRLHDGAGRPGRGAGRLRWARARRRRRVPLPPGGRQRLPRAMRSRPRVARTCRSAFPRQPRARKQPTLRCWHQVDTTASTSTLDGVPGLGVSVTYTAFLMGPSNCAGRGSWSRPWLLIHPIPSCLIPSHLIRLISSHLILE